MSKRNEKSLNLDSVWEMSLRLITPYYIVSYSPPRRQSFSK